MNTQKQVATTTFSPEVSSGPRTAAVQGRLMTIGRSGVALLLQISTRLKRRQRVSAGEGIIRVNLGSGLCVADGWINVDGGLHALACRWPKQILQFVHGVTSVRQTHPFKEYLAVLRRHRFVHHRFDYGVPFEAESVDYVFSSHMLEHLFLDDAKRLVADIYRVLKPGGLVRLAVPDLAIAVSLYQGGRKEQALAFFFTPSRSGLFDPHHYMYDFELLRSLLLSVGFVDVEHCAYRQGRLPDLELLDNRVEETLFVEARK